MCLVCRRRLPKEALRRIALQGGRFVWDHGQRLQGRGAYLCGSDECLSTFLKAQGRFLKRAFGRKLAKDGGEIEGYFMAQPE